MTPSLLFFDVNETLLDLAALDPVFNRLFDDASARGQWFATLLHWSMVMSSTGRFENFSVIARNSLDAIASQKGRKLSSAEHEQVAQAIASLPPHPDVIAGLTRLADADYRLVALTNSAQDTLNKQFANNGLNDYFEALLSVDSVRCFKPDPRVYCWAAEHMLLPPEQCRLIATHDWDVSGAMSAGMRGGYLDRGLGLHPLAIKADCQGETLTALAVAILAAEGNRKPGQRDG